MSNVLEFPPKMKPTHEDHIGMFLGNVKDHVEAADGNKHFKFLEVSESVNGFTFTIHHSEMEEKVTLSHASAELMLSRLQERL